MTTTNWLFSSIAGLLILTIVGCGLEKSYDGGSSSRLEPPHPAVTFQPVIATLQEQVQSDLERHLATQQASTIKALSTAEAFPASFKRPVVLQAMRNPWAGLMALENHGHQTAELARSGQQTLLMLPVLLDLLEAGMDRFSDSVKPIPIPSSTTLEAQVTYIVAILDQAHQLREKALRRLSQADRQFLFDQAELIVEDFSPHIADPSAQTLQWARATHRFCQLVYEQLDYGALMAAAQVLARFSNKEWLQQLPTLFQGRKAVPRPPSGVTGEVLLLRETPHGLIVIGGQGPNSYDLDSRFALVIDLGGDDLYRGTIAAAADVQHGNSIVLDLSGDDTYHGSPLGLATGRLGVGLLMDQAGNDVYLLPQGSGGSGFAGLGILRDLSGHDQYIGDKFTHGAAVGGLGLVLDEAGQDTYASFGYAIGFGGPLGIGAVVDLTGDDSYQCGDRYPSSYNVTDAPDSKPGDRLFQYDCFGLGAGSGMRLFTNDSEHLSNNLAGGLGLVIDLAGNDRYHSSNFSQGAGYFFGAGLKFDLAGNDDHDAARYGQAAGAHYGLGLFIDVQGDDHYASTGPWYNGGAAWDRSIMLCIDTGQGNDVYDFQWSSGLGRADHNAWSIFIDDGGRDLYLAQNGLGMATDNSTSAFFDLAGRDDYVIGLQPSSDGRDNGRILVDPAGGLFVDR